MAYNSANHQKQYRKIEKDLTVKGEEHTITNNVAISEPIMSEMSNRRNIGLHSQAARIYMSLFSQNFTGEQILKLADPKKKDNQTVLERLVIEELALTQSEDEKVATDARRYVLNFLNKGEVKNLPTQEEKVSDNRTLMDDFMDDILEGIILPDNNAQNENGQGKKKKK